MCLPIYTTHFYFTINHIIVFFVGFSHIIIKDMLFLLMYIIRYIILNYTLGIIRRINNIYTLMFISYIFLILSISSK